MKLLVNKNCSGYHWFECNLTGDQKYIKMYEAQSATKESSFLSGLRVYGQFDYCLIKDNKEYLLAINNIHGSEKDIFGRHTSIKLIFVGNKDEATLLLKILLTRLGDFESFSETVDSCFVSSSMSDPIYVRCNWEKLHLFIQDIDKKELSTKAEKMLSDSTLPLIIVSPENTKAMDEMSFKDKEIKKAKEAIMSLSADQYFKTIPTDNPDSDKGQSETEADVSADRYNELQKETDKLLKEISLLKDDNKRLEDLLDATKQMHSHHETDSNKRIRCYKGLIAASGAVIIALIILYILK